MKVNRRLVSFEACLLVLVLLLAGVGSRLRAESGTCSGQIIAAEADATATDR